MRIVQLIFHLGGGGAERFVVDLSNNLADRGHDVTLLVLRPLCEEKFAFNKKFLNDNVCLKSMNMPEGFSLCKVAKVHQAIKKLNPDIVHAHLNIIPYLILLPLLMNKTKFFHTVHSMPKFENPSLLLRLLFSIIYRSGKIIPVTISSFCDSSFREVYGVSNSVMIQNGRSVPQKTAEYESVRNMLSSRPGPVFVHVARFSDEKNQKLLIDAFNRLDIPFSLYFLGAGYEKANGLYDSVSKNMFFLGQVKNVSDFLLCADAFCLSSLVEGLPISLLEAMACGLTPICTPAGGIVDVIQNGKTGYLSEGFETEQYLSAIKRFLVAPIEKETIINEYKSKYSIGCCTNKYLDLYSR